MASNSIETALLALSAVDQDYATTANNVGFNGRDTQFGNSLATQVRAGKTLSDKQKVAAYKMLRTYKKQLGLYGIDYDEIEVPTFVEPKSEYLIDYHSEARLFSVHYPFSTKLNSDLKNLCYATWSKTFNSWVVSEDYQDSLYIFAAENAFEFTEAATMKIGKILTATRRDTIDINENGRAFINFLGFPSPIILNALKRIPGRKWDPVAKIWTIYINAGNIDAFYEFATKYGFTISGEKFVESLRRDVENNIAASAALDAEVHINGLGLELMPFQKAGVDYAIKNLKPGKGVYIADHMGLGKSLQALAIMKSKRAFPALVVVPKVVWLNWAREIKKCIPGTSVVLLTGKNATKATRDLVESFGAKLVCLGEDIPKADIYVLNYDLLTKWVQPKGKKTGTKVVKSGSTTTTYGVTKYEAEGPLGQIKFESIVFDEAHLLKERKSQRTKAAVVLVKQNKPEVVLCLSGTPIPNRPSELIVPIKDILGRLDEVGGWNTLWNYHCQGYSHGAKDLEGLNRKMRASFYVRRSKEEVLPELPPINWVPVDVEMENPSRYDEVEKDIANWFEEKIRENPEFLTRIAGMSKEEQEFAIVKAAEAKADSTSDMAVILTKINALRQVAAQEKLKDTIEWIEEWMRDSDRSEKLLIFGIHRNINEKIAEHFNSPLIYGGITPTTRMEAERSFQEDPECRILVCSIDAAGVGLTLTAASHVAFIEMPWRPMDLDQAVARAYGRLSDLHGVTSYLVTTPNTIEGNIVKLLERKRFLTSQGQDGTLLAQAVQMMLEKVEGGKQ